MGSGIAQVCAQAGYDVIVRESNSEFLTKGLSSIERFLNKSVEKGKITDQEKDDTIGRIKGTTKMPDLSDCDLVIEAVPEKIEIKRQVFKELDEICPNATILASNTSALSILEIGNATRRPEKVLGLHFFNPVPIMRLVEVIRSSLTNEKTLEIIKKFGVSLGKTIVVAKDSPGFIVNRLNIAFTINAIRMLESGIASREDIDTAVTHGLNYPMGPLELADFLGIDTLFYAASDMYKRSNDPMFKPPQLLEKMISEGSFGQKAGKGFYDY